MEDSSQATSPPIIEGLDVSVHVAECLEQGFSVIPNFINAAEIESIRFSFDSEVPMTEMRAIGTDTGKTLRAHNLLAKTRAVDYLFMDSRVRALVEGVLGPRVQVNVTTLFNLLPGETRQFLHQDDGLWPIPRPHPSFVCNLLIALDDFDLENGCTHLVPYSHKWFDRKVDQEIETVRVEMKAGSMLMWEGGLWHGGGANTSVRRERLGFFMSHCVHYLRPQEIQLLSVPSAVVRKMPRLLQRLLGYNRFGLGVDGRDPIDVLNDGVVFNEKARTRWF